MNRFFILALVVVAVSAKTTKTGKAEMLADSIVQLMDNVIDHPGFPESIDLASVANQDMRADLADFGTESSLEELMAKFEQMAVEAGISNSEMEKALKEHKDLERVQAKFEAKMNK